MVHYHLNFPFIICQFVLGLSDPKLGAAITEALNVQCQHVGVVPEIVRGETPSTIRPNLPYTF